MMENPEDSSMVEEREEYMVSPSGGNPFLKKAYFLKPTLPSSIDEPPFKISPCFSSLTYHFEPEKWPFNVEFQGWRCPTKDWETWVAHLASVHQSTWKKAGIYEAIFNTKYNIRKQTDLVYGLAEKWCSKTNTFIFPWGEATITLEDAMVLGGYSVLGDSVLSPLESVELKEIEKKLLGERAELYRTAAKKASTSLWLKKFMRSGHEFEHEAFLVYWLSRYVLNDGDITHRPVFSIAIHLARGTRIALAPAVLASIYRDMGLLKRKIVALNQLKASDVVLKLTLKSALQLVQVWAWERFLKLRPKPKALNYGEPRMARWDKVTGLKVENLRMVLDSAGRDFKWRPYAVAIDNWNLPKYYRRKEKWVLVGPDLDDETQSFVRCLRFCEIVGLGTIEHYLPHRVGMQFGFDQDLPCCITRPNHSFGIAWKHYDNEFRNVNLHLPSRLLEADVSTKYLKWWKQSVSGFEDETEAAEPQKKKAKSMDRSLLRTNHPLVPPGFPSKRKRMEAEYPIDEDKLTISEFLTSSKKHESFGIRHGGDGEKLLCQAQNLVSPIAEQSSSNTMKSDNDAVSMAGNECALHPPTLLEFEKRYSMIKARFEKLVRVIEELKAQRFQNKI